MTRPLIPLLALLLLPWPAWGQETKLFLPPARTKAEPQISLSATVILDRLIVVRAQTAGKTLRWYTPDKGLEALPPELYASGGKVALFAAKGSGTYRIAAWTAIGGEPTDAAEVSVTVGEPGPAPPVPPGPQPPTPPVPPAPPPAPIPVTGLRVLIVEESGDRAKLPAPQQAIIFSRPVRDWLDANCLPDKNMQSGKAWTIQDKDTDLTGLGAVWEDLRKRARTGTPWIVIDSDQGVLHEGPLPADVPSTLSLLGKFAPLKRKAG